MGLALATALAGLAAVLWPTRPSPVRLEDGRASLSSGSRGVAAGGPDTRTSRMPRLTSRRGLRGRPSSRPADVILADVADAVAAGLRAGLPPATSVALARGAVDDGSAWFEVLDDLTRGGPVKAGAGSATPGGSGAALDAGFLAGAWHLADELGAPLASALGLVAERARARALTTARVRSATAGARASMSVLMLLPLSGPLVGMVFGVDPWHLYFGSGAATVSAVIGVALAVAGVVWSRRLVAAAVRPRPAS